MQQKIALTTAHFPARGTIGDMGSGSGRGTFDLAKLYRNLKLVGVDINRVAVEQSEQKFQSPNLNYAVGDIAEMVFPPKSLDGILDSSVLHHVTSFNNFDIRQIEKTLANQVAQLKTGGVLIIRDFVVPDNGEKEVFLDLPIDDGKPAGEITGLSSAALFQKFAAEFRSSVNPNAPVPFVEHKSPRPNFARFELKLRAAAEFVLRKDYRADWETEIIEEYTYFTQKDFETTFRSNDLRIVVSMPLWNPWILENRFVGKFFITNKAGENLPFPPTNFLIVGEKIPLDAGYELVETRRETVEKPKFLKLKAYKHRQTKQIYELAERPNQTIDILPWFETNGQLFVLAKKDFPRPLVNACRDQQNLNCAHYSGYLTEPLSAIVQSPKSKVQSPIFEILRERAKLSPDEILEISQPQFYFTSPGGIDERVESFLVKIAGWEREPQIVENYTKFSSAGVVRELDALQVLRASHVGGMFDARLEINIYRLLRELNLSPSAWIGAPIKPAIQNISPEFRRVETLATEKIAAFEAVESFQNNFLELRRANFVEYDSRGNKLAETEFEYVLPKNHSKNTVAAIPFFQTPDGIFVGIEFRDLPAPQNFTGNSRLACVPAWRLPLEIKDKFAIEPFLQNAFQQDFRTNQKKSWELGGSYFSTPGVTPEIVYPFAVEIKAKNLAETDLQFLGLNELVQNLDKFQDAHLLILANRLAHSLK